MEQQWISVKDDHPESQYDVLCFSEFRELIGFFEDNEWWAKSHHGFECKKINVTHWMPLPSPPKK